MVKEELHLQEYTIFDLDLRVMVIWDVAQYYLYYVTYASANFEVATSNGWGEDALTGNASI